MKELARSFHSKRFRESKGLKTVLISRARTRSNLKNTLENSILMSDTNEAKTYSSKPVSCIMIREIASVDFGLGQCSSTDIAKALDWDSLNL